MKKINAFLLIGCIGLIITAILQFIRPNLHMDIAFGETIHILYPIFFALVVIGFGLMLKVENKMIDE